MKKIGKIVSIVLLVLAISPLTSFAAPQGYIEVEMTKQNFNQYFGYKKVKYYDEFGDWTSFSYQLYSKMQDKGYYVYQLRDFAIKGSYQERYKYKWRYKEGKGKRAKKKTETRKGINRDTFSTSGIYCLPYNIGGGSAAFESNGLGLKYDYKYSKLKKTKVNKIKGTIIFATPDNVIGIEPVYSDTYKGKISHYRLKLRYPYDENTSRKSHYNESTGSYETDYYYESVSLGAAGSYWDW